MLPKMYFISSLFIKKHKLHFDSLLLSGTDLNFQLLPLFIGLSKTILLVWLPEKLSLKENRVKRWQKR